MRTIWAVTLKEVRQISRDRLSLGMLIVFPVFLLILYGFALNFDVRHVPMGVQDRDHSAASRALVSTFVNSTYFDITAVLPADASLPRVTERGVARAILVIPERYGEDLGAGRPGRVQLLVDGADAMTATTILGYATAIVAQANVSSLRSTLLALGQTGTPPAVAYTPRVWYNPELKSTRFLLPGLIGMLMMLTAVLSTALSVVREKERGTMEQIRMAPVHTYELIVGKAFPYLIISLLATVIIIVAARVLFAIEVKGPYLDLLLATLLYLLGALGLGLLVSTIADTQALAFQVSLLLSLLPSMLLSGFVFQIRVMPSWLQAITYLVPARYYLVILRGIILKGSGLGPYWDQMGALAIFTALSLGLASLRLARKEA